MHIIKVQHDTAGEARAFLDALYYSDSVSALGYYEHVDGSFRSVAVNYDQDAETELDAELLKLTAEPEEIGREALYPTLWQAFAAGCPGFVRYEPEADDF